MEQRRTAMQNTLAATLAATVRRDPARGARMKTYSPHAAAVAATAAHPGRPATAIVHDGPDARLVIFRIEPGQRVPPHSSVATVILIVVSGSGLVTGGDEERPVGPGDVIVFEPGELHAMEATDEILIILATIAPRPGSR